MDPFSYPSDEQITKWAERYGTTGVKFYELSGLHPTNEGCIATYHEMTLAQRQLYGRLQELADNGAPFEVKRMVVASCLLHPQLEDFPHEAFAVGELFQRIVQHGHGALDAEDAGDVLPKHMINDIHNARKAAHRVFASPEFGSMYVDIATELATRSDGSIDAQALHHYWQLTPGQLRDIAATLEQTYNRLKESAYEGIKGISNANEKQARLEQIDMVYRSPFTGLDKATDGSTIPEESEDPDEPQPAPPTPVPDVPPNRPVFDSEELKGLI